VLIAPRLAHFGLFDFHRADEAFEAGRQAVRASLAQLEAQGLWS
jgi:NTE family protein